MIGVHVCLDFEDEAGKGLAGGGNLFACNGNTGYRWHRVLQEGIQKQLHTEVVSRAAEENRCEFAVFDCLCVEGCAGGFQHLQFFCYLPENSA